MKRLLAVITMVTILLGSFAFTVSAADVQTSYGLYEYAILDLKNKDIDVDETEIPAPKLQSNSTNDYMILLKFNVGNNENIKNVNLDLSGYFSNDTVKLTVYSVLDNSWTSSAKYSDVIENKKIVGDIVGEKIKSDGETINSNTPVNVDLTGKVLPDSNGIVSVAVRAINASWNNGSQSIELRVYGNNSSIVYPTLNVVREDNRNGAIFTAYKDSLQPTEIHAYLDKTSADGGDNSDKALGFNHGASGTFHVCNNYGTADTTTGHIQDEGIVTLTYDVPDAKVDSAKIHIKGFFHKNCIIDAYKVTKDWDDTDKTVILGDKIADSSAQGAIDVNDTVSQWIDITEFINDTIDAGDETVKIALKSRGDTAHKGTQCIIYVAADKPTLNINEKNLLSAGSIPNDTKFLYVKQDITNTSTTDKLYARPIIAVYDENGALKKCTIGNYDVSKNSTKTIYGFLEFVENDITDISKIKLFHLATDSVNPLMDVSGI